MCADLRGLRIHPRNKPLLELPPEHPAVQALIKHAECWRDCAGREIDWPDRGHEVIDQGWDSPTDGRRWTLSGFVYSYICYDLILDGWLTRERQLTASERSMLDSLPRLRALLNECRSACSEMENAPVLNMIEQVEACLAAQERAVHARIAEDGIKQLGSHP